MTDKLPNYAAMEPPDGKPVDSYSTHERRADILRRIIEVGSPGRIKQVDLARRYDVAESTISRDMDRLREAVGDQLGNDAKLTTKALFERVTADLLEEEEDWRSTKAAWDVVMDWNEWLAELGKQDREPRRSELDVDMRSRHSEVSYQVVREGDDEPLPTSDDGDGVDYDALGFTSGPAEIPVEPSGQSDSGSDRNDSN